MKTTPVKIGPFEVGNGDFVAIAGPCSIESEDQLFKTTQHVKQAGASMLRGGIYKLRTRPDTFQGLGLEAISLAKKAKEKWNMPFFSEITDPRQLEVMDEVVDVFQIGSRNMHNYELLKELGKTTKPVLLKRGFSGKIEEWLHAADYLSSNGNENIILCERGIRTFETATRNTFDINAIAYIKQNTSYPIIADPSHGTGLRNLVTPIALASIAAGADGMIIEVHPQPENALSDGFQALTFDDFSQLMFKTEKLLNAFDRKLALPLEVTTQEPLRTPTISPQPAVSLMNH